MSVHIPPPWPSEGDAFDEVDAIEAKRATARAADVRPIIAELQAEGVTSLAQLAAALTERGIPTSRGADRWSPMQVSRVLKAVAHGT